MTDDEADAADLAEFRQLHNLAARRFPGLTVRDVICFCGGVGCGRMLIRAGALGGRSVGSVPPEVCRVVGDRRYCARCVANGRAEGAAELAAAVPT